MSPVVSCARCLAQVGFRREADISWMLAPAHERPRETKPAPKSDRDKPARDKERETDNEKDDGLELTSEDLDVVYYDDLVLPLEPLVEEQVQLELPMKALCRDDCRGLCPICGADLNLAPCGCRPPSDERWKSLRTLLESGN